MFLLLICKKKTHSRKAKMGMRIKLHSTDHPNNLLKELNKCRLSENMCDVTIVVGQRSFAAHRAVLACAAAYFHNLFMDSGVSTYVVDFITPTNFEKVLSFVYTAELFTDLINVGVIYDAAEKLGMADLLRACHATFPDLEVSPVVKQSATSSDGHNSNSVDLNHSVGDPRCSSSDRSYVSPRETAGCYKGDDRNPACEPSQSIAVPFPLPPKIEEEEDEEAVEHFPSPPPLASQSNITNTNLGLPTSTTSCQPYKIQSNGDYSKNCFFATGSALGYSTGGNSCSGSTEHLPDRGFRQMDDLQLEELEEEDLQFEDVAEGLGPPEDVIELSDASEDEVSISHGGRKAMPCQVCKKVLEPNLQLIRHHAREHIDLQTGNCKVCKTHFQDHASRVTHVLSHVGIFLFSCDMCETKFFTQWQLTLHRRDGISANNVIVHPSDPLPGEINSFGGGPGSQLACNICRKTLVRDFHTVRSHILEHVNLKGLTCGLCDLRHPNPCSLMWHALSHMGLSIFSCSVCANSFVDRHLLEKHLAVHQGTDSPVFRCHLCGQSFDSDAACRHHISQHRSGMGDDHRQGFVEQHGILKRKVPEEFLPDDAALQAQTGHSKYSCKVCGKKFSHTSEFNYHRRIHTGEKPYQCKVCQKFFRGRSTIKCHLKTHSGALMYRCTVCGHYSSTLNLMSKHIGVHRGNLPLDFTIEQTFMYVIHSKEGEKPTDSGL